MDGCSWLAVVVLGWQWLWIVPLISLWCFFGSEMFYFIVVDMLFYCDVYIIFVLKAKIDPLLLDVL